MFTHIMVGSNDLAKATAFYDATFEALGGPKPFVEDTRTVYRGDSATFCVVTPADGAPACRANGGTIGFAAKDVASVNAWHVAGVANGGTDEGGPGHRPNAPGNAYGAYLRDPDGNKICAFCQLPA